MWRKDLIKRNHRQRKVCLSPCNNAASLDISHNLPGVRILTRAGLSWAMNKSKHFMSFLHPYLFTRTRKKQPLGSWELGAAFASLPSDPWMNGGSIEPGCSAASTHSGNYDAAQEQVGERGFWDGMGGRSHHQHYGCTHGRLYVSADV